MKVAVLFLVVIVAAVYIVGCIKTVDDCQDRGGRVVRGAFWYECVEPLP